jgi:hypothetical protein
MRGIAPERLKVNSIMAIVATLDAVAMRGIAPERLKVSYYTTVALLEKKEEASPPRSPKKISSYLR